MKNSVPIRVMLVDDHEMVRSGLAFFLSAFNDLELVGQAENGKEALRLCQQVRPDVILMDLVMPEMDGVTAIRRIRAQNAAIQVIALTSFVEHERVQQALDAGAIGYLLKNTTIDELAGAIRAAFNAKPTLAPEAFHALVTASSSPRAPGADLTAREREVLALLVQGLNNTQIATRMVLSSSTVKTHVSNILSKLGVSNRVEAVTMALQHNLAGMVKDE
jgi:two-component system, NarL family, response regulator LiaR